MSAQWKKFSGSEDQINEILNAKDGFKYLTNIGAECHYVKKYFDDEWNKDDIKQLLGTDYVDSYLICNPHPHADMIIEWARTGREVYFYAVGRWYKDHKPEWLPRNKYSFNPDGDGK